MTTLDKGHHHGPPKSELKENSGPPIVIGKEKQSPYVLNINEGMQQRQIDNARIVISMIEEKVNALKPEWDEKQQFYNEAAKEFRIVDEKMQRLMTDIKNQNDIINVMEGYMNKSGAKVLKLSGGHHEHGYKSPKKVKWMQEIAKLLIEVDTFLTPDQVMDKLERKPEVIAAANETEKGYRGMRQAVISNMQVHAKLLGQPRKKGIQLLSMYNGKIGLAEWVDPATGSLSIKHTHRAKEFMYKE